jgi:hypothetical protein
VSKRRPSAWLAEPGNPRHREEGQSPPPRGDADKHATAHKNKVRKDTVLRCSPKVLFTSRIYNWARNRVHNKHLHLNCRKPHCGKPQNCWQKPCPQQVFTLGPGTVSTKILARNRIRDKSLHLPLETVSTKSLCTWIRTPCPQKTFKLGPETVPTNSICMWAQNPVLNKSSKLQTATAGTTSGKHLGHPLAAIRSQLKCTWPQSGRNWATMGAHLDNTWTTIGQQLGYN